MDNDQKHVNGEKKGENRSRNDSNVPKLENEYVANGKWNIMKVNKIGLRHQRLAS